MKVAAAFGVILLAAACSPAPASETAAPAAPAAIEAAAPAPMAPPQIAIPTNLIGRWGVTMDACAPANASKDGVIEITASTVAMGPDLCAVARTEPEGAGTLMFLQCKSSEGSADYERDAQFISSTPETMTWVNEGGTGEPYVRCS